MTCLKSQFHHKYSYKPTHDECPHRTIPDALNLNSISFHAKSSTKSINNWPCIQISKRFSIASKIISIAHSSCKYKLCTCVSLFLTKKRHSPSTHAYKSRRLILNNLSNRQTEHVSNPNPWSGLSLPGMFSKNRTGATRF